MNLYFSVPHYEINTSWKNYKSNHGKLLLQQVFFLFVKDGVLKVAKEFPASGIAPYDPSHNSTAFYLAEKNEIYAGTVADFSGTDALISKRQIAQPDDLGLRTERSDMKCLNGTGIN